MTLPVTLCAVAFAAGAALLQLQAALPPQHWLWALPVILACAFRFRWLVVPAAFAIGFAWAAACAHWRMADWLRPELEGRDIDVVGVVSSLPALAERGVRFELDVESAAERVPKKLLVAWYRTPFAEDDPALLLGQVHPGERWLFTLRLRRPHGLVNPHGFDYEAWLLERGVGATGYVRMRGEQRLLGHRSSILDRIELVREEIRDRFREQLGATPAAGILAALAVGDQRAISGEEWRLFSRTGVTHLMSISGLHVTLVSGLVAWLVGALWRRLPRLALRLPARKAAACAAIFAALGYTLLAGFGVPAQRTFWMVCVVAAALWAGRIASPWRTLALALAVVVLMDPWAPLAPGLWLSFGAVLLIFYIAAGWSQPASKLVQWTHMQWAITLGLAPAALLLVGLVSVAGPLATALAIPLVSVVITPLALMAALLPVAGLVRIAAWLVDLLLLFLEWCAALPGALWTQHVPALWAVVAALAGAVWLVAPRGVPWRACGLALMAPAFMLLPPTPAPGEAWLTTLDVGQGLAVVVRTASRTLLYDAGPAYGTESDSGLRVVVPALQAAGVSRLDKMVITHEDSDHLGGALSVLESMPVDAFASSLPHAHPFHALAGTVRRCRAGEGWEWDGVRFDFLHPAELMAKRNDHSCVLRVAAAGGAMLLTGDIERASEERLVRMGLGKSDVLLVPHHGSRSSSTTAFIEAVSPRFAVVPAGYRNRFGHPAKDVVQRYADAGVEILRTDRDGAVTVSLDSSGIALRGERESRGRYWLK
ncbi:MAG: DNA internalization-related competence protein ComEC/Rec2 [Betaproteobacteria bacterium]